MSGSSGARWTQNNDIGRLPWGLLIEFEADHPYQGRLYLVLGSLRRVDGKEEVLVNFSDRLYVQLILQKAFGSDLIHLLLARQLRF